MTAPPSAGPSPSLLQRFDEAQRALAALLAEALSTSAPGAFVEAIGLEAIERYLPSDARLRLLQSALQAGRAGRPFDDRALLAAVSPAVLVAHLPAATLREALVRLAPPSASMEVALEISAVIPVVSPPVAPVAATAPVLPGAVAMVAEAGPGEVLESLDEDDELTVALDDEGTKALLAQLPPEDDSST